MLPFVDARTGAPLRVALVIPAFNEEEVIGQTLRGLPQGLFAQVIVAVNGSTDRTAAVARDAGAEVVEIRERGYGAACLAAIPRIDCDVAVFLQADGSERAEEAIGLIGPIARGEADMVIGSRTLGIAEAGALLPHQRFGNWLSSFLIFRRFGHRYSDIGPFRAIRLSSLKRLPMRERTYGWTVEMQFLALTHGVRVMEVPVSYSVRRAGSPKVAGNFRASIMAGIVILRTVLRREPGRRPSVPPAAGP